MFYFLGDGLKNISLGYQKQEFHKWKVLTVTCLTVTVCYMAMQRFHFPNVSQSRGSM